MNKRVALSLMLLTAPAFTTELKFPSASGDAQFVQAASMFHPAASVDKAPICGQLLARVRQEFAVDNFYYNAAFTDPLEKSGFVAVPISSLDEQGLPDKYGNRRFALTMKGGSLLIEPHRFGGCGGGCETQSMKFMPGPNATAVDSEALDYWSIYTNDIDWYAIGISRESIIAYQLNGNVPAKACQVDFGVPQFGEPEDADLRAVLPAIENFDEAIGGVTRGAGSCGSLQSASRLAGESDLAMRALVFRPWALEGSIPVDELEAWSLNGISEFDAMRRLKQQFLHTRDALAAFYLSKGYARNKADSTILATRALSGAIAQSFWFPSTEPSEDAPENESLLRQALLERWPMNEIREFRPIPAEFGVRYSFNFDPLLALAIRYPEALEYLLQRGWDPDVANPFGKTPLMFAAQYDQPRAVELLLAHGADPNAMTWRPHDNCFYTIQYTHATPLHYAARYGSPQTVEKLIAGGALTFAEGTYIGAHSKGSGFPINWFRNRREAPIQSTEFFEKLLAPPDNEKQERIARELAARATRQYRAGRIEAAYRDLRNALNVTPNDVMALSDFALIALRADHVGESLQAAARVRGLTQDTATLGNAWFNTGLACLQQRGYGSYDGSYFCTGSEVHPFLLAWRAVPSAPREKKIAEVLAQSRARSCIVGEAGIGRQYWFVLSTDSSRGRYQQDIRVYVRHPLKSPPPPRAVTWEQNSTARSPKVQSFSSSFVESYEFSSFAVTVMTTDQWPPDRILVEGKPCEPRDQTVAPKPRRPSQYELFKPKPLTF